MSVKGKRQQTRGHGSAGGLLPLTAEYALRLVTVLATGSGSELVSLADLTEQANLPHAYAAKVLRKLVVAGLVHARRGRGGGFTLARPAGAIRVVDVLSAVDVDLADGSCAFGAAECREDRPCPLHGPWSRLRDAARAWAERTTFADLR